MWLPLFELSQVYDEVYNWFDHLIKDGCHILGYVIMPNHLHCILFPTNQEKPLNKLVAEGKRFMAYGIVKRLKKNQQSEILDKLSDGVQENEIKKGKKHQVFRLSFDAKMCNNISMLETKLDYAHRNPVSGKWNLAEDYTDYVHSSASFYDKGKDNKYVSHYKRLMNEIEI
ncbi:hypothetical protein [Ekhidna sp.]|uniref:hypothetical protein n=1 Tax=Ekhidna sp. TaxID=2608089 RepID=UPI003CCBB22F